MTSIIQTQKSINKGSAINQTQQYQEIKAIFDEFKDPQSNCLDSSEFLNILKQTGSLSQGVSKNCTLLTQKLEKRLGQQVREDDFHKLFNFGFEDEENFELLFELIDSSKSGKIGKEELKRANNLYQLQLTDRDIEIMINYSGSQEKDTISKKTLWALMKSQV